MAELVAVALDHFESHVVRESTEVRLAEVKSAEVTAAGVKSAKVRSTEVRSANGATPESHRSSPFSSQGNADLLPVRGIFADFAEPKRSLPRLVWCYTRMPAEIALGVGLVLFAAWHWWPR